MCTQTNLLNIQETIVVFRSRKDVFLPACDQDQGVSDIKKFNQESIVNGNSLIRRVMTD